MQSIGERLEEARKRRGISIREASEATKIRGDYLLSFENNQFEVGLPEIYIRGFLRNYAGFLKVDSAKIVTDFNAGLLSEGRAQKRDGRELFGRMELPERNRNSSGEGGGNATSSATARPQVEEPAEYTRGGGGLSPEVINYLKIGAIIAAGIITILAIVLLVQKIFTSSGSGTSERPAVTQPGTPAETMTLIAVGDVTVTVEQLSDGTKVFDGPLAAGETKVVSVQGKARITYNRGANLQVEWRGQRYRMTVQELGFTPFPP